MRTVVLQAVPFVRGEADEGIILAPHSKLHKRYEADSAFLNAGGLVLAKAPTATQI